MKLYTKPEIEISVFATEDIITASGGGNDDPVINGSLQNGGELSETNSGLSYDDIF